MCTDKILYSPSNNGIRGIARAKRSKALGFDEVSKLLDAVRYVANGKDISIADATELLRSRNAFPAVYKMMSPTVSSRQLANRMRSFIN